MKNLEPLLIAPCRNACPLGRPIQRHNVLLSYFAKMIKGGLAKEEVFLKVYDEMFHFNPLFGVCGYICGICENFCNRREVDQGVRIRLIERFVFDWYYQAVKKEKLPPYRHFDVPHREGKIAIIGGGPAGLTASFFLAQRGYQVNIFEHRANLGGALRLIPSFRLPKDVLDFAIDQIVTPLNIKVYTEKAVDIPNLRRQGYQAMLIATGTPIPRPLPKFAQGCEGVENAIAVLTKISEGTIEKQRYRGKEAVVIGGSGVAVDTARSLNRFGMDVGIVCLESKDRTSKDGILITIEDEQCAKEEGIKFYYSRGLENLKKTGPKMELVLSKCVSVYDIVDGRKIFNPQFDPKNLIYLSTDYLIFAIGQMPDRKYLKGLLDEKGRIVADHKTLSTKEEGIFVAGDVFRIGRASEAIRDGKEAAISIMRYLEGKDLKQGGERKVMVAELRYDKKDVPPKPAQRPQRLPVERRASGFELEEGGFDLEQLISETERCLHCDGCESCKACITLGLIEDNLCKMYVIDENCDGCGYCVDVCIYNAIGIIEYIKNGGIKKTIEVDTMYCKGCGLCQATCPKEGCAITGFSLAELKAQVEKALEISI